MSVFIYIGAVLLAAAGLAVVAWRIHPLNTTASESEIVILVVLCVLGTLGSTMQERNVGGRIGFSFTSIIVLAAVALTGPFGAAVVGAVTCLLVAYRQRLEVRAFNVGMT